MRPPTSFACAVAVLTAGVAGADTVRVDDGAPVNADELQRSIDARAGQKTRPVRVHALTPGVVEVEVDGVSQVVAVEPGDERDSTRVVALVVISMLVAPPEDASEPRSIADHEVPSTLRSATRRLENPRAPNWWLRFGALRMDEDNGYTITALSAGVARRLTAHTRLTGTLGVGRLDAFLDSTSRMIPTRLGIEGWAHSAAIEIGVQNLFYRDGACDPEWGRHTSLYGAARALIPVGGVHVTAELGGFRVVSRGRTVCNVLPNYTDYGGWFGGGLEWPI